MPIWLRKFTYQKIKDRFEKKNQQVDEQNNIINQNNAERKMAQPYSPKSNNSYKSNIKSPT